MLYILIIVCINRQHRQFSSTQLIDSEYDPKRGIIIRNIQKDSPLNYYCLALGNNGVMREKKEFIIKITGISFLEGHLAEFELRLILFCHR